MRQIHLTLLAPCYSSVNLASYLGNILSVATGVLMSIMADGERGKKTGVISSQGNPESERAAAVVHRDEEHPPVKLTRVYAALSRINRTIMRAATRDGLFEKFCRILVEDGGFDMAWVGWRDTATFQIVPQASCGAMKAVYLRSVRVSARDDAGRERADGFGVPHRAAHRMQRHAE